MVQVKEVIKMTFEHITYDIRKVISNGLSNHLTATKLSEITGYDVSSIAKELKRNRQISKEAYRNSDDPICKTTLRYPYVCNGCEKKYFCHKRQYRYDVKYAQDRADYNLVAPRRGINLSKEEFNIINKRVHDGILNKNSIYHISKTLESVNISPSTLYRYINNGYLTTKRINLPYAVSYKKRRKQIKKYEYLENRKIDRSNRTFLDYLSYVKRHPNEYEVQMDFLGSIKQDQKKILTLLIPELHYTMLFLIEKPNSKKIVELLDYLEDLLGIKGFKKIFPLILTDRDPSFNNYEEIEFNNITGELRTKIFYCDSFKSNQKGSVENMNKQLRKYFPKGKPIDQYKQSDIASINEFINEQKLNSLSGFSPNEAFTKIYGNTVLEKLKYSIANYNK